MVQKARPPEATYEVVVENNLFWPDRSENSVKNNEKPQPKKKGPDPRLLKVLQATAKQVSLYGVLITDGEKKALIRSPGAPALPGRKNNQQVPGGEIKWVKVGDPVNRFTVNDITKSGVVLGAEGLKFDIALYDQDRPKPRAPQKPIAGPIVIDTKKGPEPAPPAEKAKPPEPAPPAEKAKAPAETGNEKKSPGKAGQKVMPPTGAESTEPKKR
ncbi:MAG: hypothetical protein K9M96_09000 [Deltaproteobacteria bacterium]|nr:hypothetical protein [Deltaproteobacteria bacterium]